jgi:hypothetical protein
LPRLFVTVALFTAAVLVALGAPPPASAVAVRASADAAVTAARPKQRDSAKAPLRVGGPGRWRVLLSFRVPAGVVPVRQATLRVWAARRPARRVSVRRLAAGWSWREGRVTVANGPPGTVDAGAWSPSAHRCSRCRGGAWLSIDVTRAVHGVGTVGFVLTARTPRPLVLASRGDRRHAPELAVEPRSSDRAAGTGSTAPRPGSGVGTHGPAPGATGGGTLVAAAGDLACEPGRGDPCRQQATSDLVLGLNPAAFLALGDMAYPDGTLDQLRAWYEPSWGRLGARVHPVPGNHDFHTAGAAGYFDFFNGAGTATGRVGDRGLGWYSFDLVGWHIVALNSACGEIGGCGPGSPEEAWLRADLAAHRTACTLAFWHTPRFSSGPHSDQPLVAPLWYDLQESGAELVLSGHDHHYERFAPQNAWGAADPRGLRQFIAGTGGKGTRPVVRTASNSEVRDDVSLGALLLTLRPGGYDWRFAAAVGTFADAGSDPCH